MTQAEKKSYVARKKIVLKLFIVAWAILVGFVGTAGAANEVGLLENTKVGDTLAGGSAQAVLSVGILGLSAACVFLTRQLLKVQNERVEETQTMFKEIVTANTGAFERNTAALDKVAEGYKQCEKQRNSGQ